MLLATLVQNLPCASGPRPGLNLPLLVIPYCQPRGVMRTFADGLKRKLTKKDKRRIALAKKKKEKAMVIKRINKNGKRTV